ncbi:bifunctional riboflavin kinase/FAD synthetase, partial [Patescibacteria group bacterium]|nr:bifunctional riboflavin kinase/FAD synthetase [Patescibacteria group bacterium]
IYFLRYLRKTKKFKTIEELKKQIKKDTKKARHFLMSVKDIGRRT